MEHTFAAWCVYLRCESQFFYLDAEADEGLELLSVTFDREVKLVVPRRVDEVHVVADVG